mgnify:CR=1 FL=1
MLLPKRFHREFYLINQSPNSLVKQKLQPNEENKSNHLQPEENMWLEVDMEKLRGSTFMFKKTKLFNVPIPKLGTFEEINLRFYVTRTDENNTIKRGVVFINETIPYKIVAWMANKLYNEHYTVVPTKHEITNDGPSKKVNFEWLLNKKWNIILNLFLK